MGGFFNNLYQMYGQDYLDPESEMAVGGGGMPQVPFAEPPDEEMPAAPVAGPRVIPPRVPTPGMERYAEHVRNMPTNKPSTLNTIISGLGAFATAWGSRDPTAGIKTFDYLSNMPFRQAMEEWKAKGKELGDLATMEEKGAMFSEEQGTKNRGLDIRREELQSKIDQINKTYEIAAKNATTAEARVKAQKDKDDAMKLILEERNKIDRFEAETGRQRVGVDASRAKTEAERVGHYGRYVDAAGQGRLPKPSSVNDMYNAEQDVLTELMASDPAFREFFNYDENSGTVTPIMEDWDPEQLARRQALMTKVGVETQKRLGGIAGGGAPPYWQMRPPVVIPPNRRRLP